MFLSNPFFQNPPRIANCLGSPKQNNTQLSSSKDGNSLDVALSKQLLNAQSQKENRTNNISAKILTS